MREIVKELLPRVSSKVEELLSQIVGLADDVFEHPELAFQEVHASSALTSALEEAGFDVKRGVAGLDTAFVATLDGDGPVVGLLAEYDALPKVGHACGHNLFGATSLGAALVIAGLKSEGHLGSLRVIGTPAEEKGGGKCIMAEAGVFDDLDVALMIHPGNNNGLGGGSLALSQYYVCFTGRSAHAAASPEKGINALDAVIGTFNTINALRQHLRDDARIHGIITDGGAAANIVPEYAEAEFLVRSADEDYQASLVQKFKNCAQAAALATGCSLELKQDEIPYQATRPNSVLQELFGTCFELLGKEVTPAGEPKGSSDVGNVSQLVPTAQASVDLGAGETALHSPEFADAVASELRVPYLETAVSVLATAALACFRDPQIVARAHEQFIG